MENISLKQNLKESWVVLKTNYKVLLLATIFMSIATIIGESENIISQVISLIFSTIFQMGFIKITLDILDNKKPEIKTILSQNKKFFKYILMMLVTILIIATPIILVSILAFGGLIFKGFFVANIGSALWSSVLVAITLLAVMFFVIPRLMFANVAMIDNDEKVLESIKTSFFITKNRKLQTIFLFFAITFLNILGVALFFVGLLITIPLSQLMISKYYRQISGKLMPINEEIPTNLIQVENSSI